MLNIIDRVRLFFKVELDVVQLLVFIENVLFGTFNLKHFDVLEDNLRYLVQTIQSIFRQVNANVEESKTII